MFAMTSGTTGEPKRLPITAELFREYRSGWLHLGRRRVRRSSGPDAQEDAAAHAATGNNFARRAACRAGRSAAWRPRRGRGSARCLFLPPPATTRIHDAAAKHYATLRFALATKNIGMIVTANPSSLVEFARRANQQCESLLRDIHDGTLSCDVPARCQQTARRVRSARRRPERARELERLVESARRACCRNTPGRSFRCWRCGRAVRSACSCRNCRNCTARPPFAITACRPAKAG